MSKVYFELWILQSFKKKTVEQETSDPLHFPLGYCAFYVEILCRKYIFLELPLLSLPVSLCRTALQLLVAKMSNKGLSDEAVAAVCKDGDPITKVRPS